MTAFTVHEPPGGSSASKIERAERLHFVRDGFSWKAALLSPIYLVFRGEWLALAIYAGAAVVLGLVLALFDANGVWYSWMFLLLNIVIGFELADIRRWSLARRGWQEIATVSGRIEEDAERRFFDLWLPTVPEDGLVTQHQAGGHPFTTLADDTTSRIEASVRRLSERLRAKYIKT